jgi:hypothetical protein
VGDLVLPPLVSRMVDAVAGRLGRRRRVLVDAAIPTHFAILAPVYQRLLQDPRIHVRFSAAAPARAGAINGVTRITRRGRLAWRHFDLCLDADPLSAVRLHRCRRRMTFQQGMAGRFDAADPEPMRAALAGYDRVGFINASVLGRYVARGIVPADRAVLVGYPKVDALANGRYDASAVHSHLQLEMHRPTAIYAPTWSSASSLHVAGEAIVRSLLDSGFNVIVKLHDRSLAEAEPDAPAPIDWRARFMRLNQPGRLAFVEAADSGPYLAASDVMVTDHSSIGFEFCLLDRPIVVFDTPHLTRMAHVHPGRIAQLRRAARVIDDASETGPVALAEIENHDHFARARHEVVRDVFYEPGTATARAMSVVYELLGLPPGALVQPAHPSPARASL